MAYQKNESSVVGVIEKEKFDPETMTKDGSMEVVWVDQAQADFEGRTDVVQSCLVKVCDCVIKLI